MNKAVTLTLELSEKDDGYRAKISTESFSLSLTDASVEAALARLTPTVASVFPILASDPCALSIGPVEDDHSRRGPPWVIDAAIEQSRDVRFDYTDAHGNRSTRTATPVSRGWGNGDLSPRRKMIATHDGIDKTFYLDKISRIELV